MRIYWRSGIGIDFMYARFTDHGFGRHSHPTYAIGVLERGREEITFAGKRVVATAGDLVVFNPETPHTGQPLDPDGWTYRVLYPTAEALARVTGQPPPFLQEGVVSDATLATAVWDAHETLQRSSTSAGGEQMRAALQRLCQHYSKNDPRSPVLSQHIHEARRLLLSDLQDPPSGEELADHLGVNRYDLARAFAKGFGLPPHSFVNEHRIRRATELLDLGHPIAEVAVTVGFSDQPHLTRHFRKARGITPGEYARKNVQ